MAPVKWPSAVSGSFAASALRPNTRCAVVNCRRTLPSPPSHGWKRLEVRIRNASSGFPDRFSKVASETVQSSRSKYGFQVLPEKGKSVGNRIIQFRAELVVLRNKPRIVPVECQGAEVRGAGRVRIR